MGKIFYIMGKSASGKDTLFKRLMEDRSLKLKTIVTYTTRPKRSDEIEGVAYHFIDENRVEKLKSQGKIIELRAYSTVLGVWKYMTVDDGQIDLSEHNYLMIGTLESYKNVREYFGLNMLVPLYIYVDDGVRLQRALDRERMQKNPEYTELCRRFLADEEDFKPENLVLNSIRERYVNNSIEDCLEMLKTKISEEIKNKSI